MEDTNKTAKPEPRSIKIKGSKTPIPFDSVKHYFGCEDEDFVIGMLEQVFNIGARGDTADLDEGMFALAIVRESKPQGPLEAMLVAQMATVHMATLHMARRLATSGNMMTQDSAERAVNKLARTYILQMDALKRYRENGQQKVVVENVTVHPGGQANVGQFVEATNDTRSMAARPNAMAQIANDQAIPFQLEHIQEPMSLLKVENRRPDQQSAPARSKRGTS